MISAPFPLRTRAWASIKRGGKWASIKRASRFCVVIYVIQEHMEPALQQSLSSKRDLFFETETYISKEPKNLTKVSLAEEFYKRDLFLQKRPVY